MAVEFEITHSDLLAHLKRRADYHRREGSIAGDREAIPLNPKQARRLSAFARLLKAPPAQQQHRLTLAEFEAFELGEE